MMADKPARPEWNLRQEVTFEDSDGIPALFSNLSDFSKEGVLGIESTFSLLAFALPRRELEPDDVADVLAEEGPPEEGYSWSIDALVAR
jgi:hypothetical protein